MSNLVRFLTRATVVIVFLTLAGCSALFGGGALFGRDEENQVRPWQQIPGGDPERGYSLIQEYGCDTCHAIPGLPGPESMVGPPLNDWAECHYIAGALPNTPENLIIWIMEPQSTSLQYPAVPYPPVEPIEGRGLQRTNLPPPALRPGVRRR